MTDDVALFVRISREQRKKLKRIATERERPVAWVVRNLIDRVEEPK